MATFAERMVQRYPQQQDIFSTTKADVVTLIEHLKATISGLDDFSLFPEGSPGIIVYALLKDASHSCPDLGDLNWKYQGLTLALKASFEEISDSLRGRVGWPSV